MTDKNLQYHISYFLSNYISGERGLSQNTFLSYNDTFKLLVRYFYESLHKPVNKIDMEDFCSDNIKGFLKDLETNGISVSTRNQRLAAIKSFCKYVQLNSPQYVHTMQQILEIPSKRNSPAAIQYLTAKQLEMLLKKPNSTDKYGFKDLLILTVLSDSGIRVSELINIKVSDVRPDNPATILIHGKGNKDRWVPISDNTASLLRLYFKKENLYNSAIAERYLFVNRSNRQFTRAGIAYIIQKYVSKLHEEYPMEFPAKLTPHCLRHTKAMLLLQAGQNLVYIRDILGHAHIKTTEIYARSDSRQIRAAIEAVQSQIAVPDTENVSYCDNHELLSWLIEYCS